MPKLIKVLVADDHKLIRTGLTMILQQNGNFEVVGEAENGQAALDLSLKTQPDILLLDVEMPGAVASFQVIKELRRRTLPIKIVVMSGEAIYEDAALELGADGFANKRDLKEQLAATLLQLAGCAIIN